MDLFENKFAVPDQFGKNPTILIFFLSGFFGFCIGMFGYAHWQATVESAQVLSGVVTYPRPTSFYMYHVKLWTILNQTCALFLYFGISEKTLSFVFSGLNGMLSFQALSLCTFAVCRCRLLALASPFLVQFTDAANFGVVYPVWLLGTINTYGVVGLSFMLLILALIGTEEYKLAGFLAGVAPAVHPSLGMSCWLIILICFLWNFRYLRDPFRQAAKFFLIGCSISTASLIAQLLISRNLPKITPEAASRYLSVFIRYWDGHRAPVNFLSLGVLITVASMVISLLWLWLFKEDLPLSSTFLLRAFAVSGCLALGFSILTWMPPETVPNSLLILMPGRLFNLNVLSFMALLIGLMGRYRSDLWVQTYLAALIPLSWIVGRRLREHALLGAVMLISVAVLLLLRLSTKITSKSFSRNSWNAISPHLPRRIASLFLAVLMVKVCVDAGFLWRVTKARFRDWTNDPLFTEVSKGRGLLLTGGPLRLMQLRTRRPVLLSGGELDVLTYTLECGPEMDRVLREIYGIDLFNPPAEAKRTAAVPAEFNRIFWESKTPQQWGWIKRQFGVNDVLTYADWKLELPEISRNTELILYRIPD